MREIYGAAGYVEDCRTLIIRVETDNGIESLGEATQGRPDNSYETLETVADMVRQYFAPTLIGGLGMDLSADSIGTKRIAVLIGQGSACTPILSAADMRLHVAMKNAQVSGEMTNFLRLGAQNIFSKLAIEAMHNY